MSANSIRTRRGKRTIDEPDGCGDIEEAAEMALCPVCKMPVNEREARFKSEHEGTTYYFHSEEEKRIFDRNPHDFAGRPGLMDIR